MTDPRTGPDQPTGPERPTEQPTERPTEQLTTTAPADGLEPADGVEPDDRLELDDTPEVDDRPVPPVRPAATSEPAEPPAPVPAGRRRTRIGTVVLGLVLAAVAATVWVDRVLERHVSLGGVATGVMIAAGALLLGGAVLRPDPRNH